MSWSTGAWQSGRKTSNSRFPSNTASAHLWDTGYNPSDFDPPLHLIDHFTHVPPPPSSETKRRPLTHAEKTGKKWEASNYGRPAPRGWDTGAQYVKIQPPSDPNDPHIKHHENLHKISLRRKRNTRSSRKRNNKPVLKIHRYPWNKEPLVIGGVDCGEPKTLHLSQQMSKWRHRSERQLKINQNGGKLPSTQSPVIYSTKKCIDDVQSSHGITLDPGKYRRRKEAVAKANHDVTLIGQFSRMQQYQPNLSKLKAARSNERRRRGGGSDGGSDGGSGGAGESGREVRPTTMPRSLQQSIGGSETDENGMRPRSGSLKRRLSRSSPRSSSPRSPQSMISESFRSQESNNVKDIDATIYEQPRWEQIRNQLIEVVVGECLYRLADLRMLFDETLKNSKRIEYERNNKTTSSTSSDANEDENEIEAATKAVLFVCNELDVPAIGRLVIEHPELLIPHDTDSSTGGRVQAGTAGICGSSDSEGEGDGPLKITHWSQSQMLRETL